MHQCHWFRVQVVLIYLTKPWDGYYLGPNDIMKQLIERFSIAHSMAGGRLGAKRDGLLCILAGCFLITFFVRPGNPYIEACATNDVQGKVHCSYRRINHGLVTSSLGSSPETKE